MNNNVLNNKIEIQQTITTGFELVGIPLFVSSISDVNPGNNINYLFGKNVY